MCQHGCCESGSENKGVSVRLSGVGVRECRLLWVGDR